MPSTVPYNPTWDFPSDPAPANQVNAQALQTQFDLIAANLADFSAALSVSIRDDNTLSDALVRIRNLHPELATYLATIATGTVVTNALAYYFPVRAASTGNVASPVGVQTIDGVALVSGDRVLLKDQTDKTQNGLWTVHAVGDPAPNAAGIWVRTADLPAGVSSGSGWAVIVSEGTVNANTAWAILAGGTPLPTVGTSALTFFAVFDAFPVSIAHGGTGATTAAAARTNLSVIGKATGTITGDGTTVNFPITHTLGTTAIVAVSVLNASGNSVGVSWQSTSGQVTIAFGNPPAVAEAFTVNIAG